LCFSAIAQCVASACNVRETINELLILCFPHIAAAGGHG
jgi:hypothetical protein